MEALISIVNKLQDVFASLGTEIPIDLPQIAVVGEQSAGKSSVLENCVGRDFLPRGSGIVTRRPLILQLINHNGNEYGEFLHKRGEQFFDFLKVRQEIEVETERVTGKNKNISPVPINLRIYSPRVLNLTLIDLPGLTKVPVGDQPIDIEKQIRDMILQYISNPSCLILAVTPAVIDLANSEALKISREVDPRGLRTIGVITKIDLMDRGTDCRAVLSNSVYTLKRGYIGVVNRGQSDIEGKKDINSAQESERKYFLEHPAYRNMVDRLGSRYLQQSLHHQLGQHIKESLPTLRQKIKERISELEKDVDVKTMGDNSTSSKARTLMMLLQEFSRDIDSTLGYQQESVQTTELNAGSKINKLLTHRFVYEVSKIKSDPLKIKKEIKIAIQNAQGVRSTIFTPDVSFTAVVKAQIEEIRQYCLKIVSLVVAEIRNIIEKSASDKFSKYPCLFDEILSFCIQGLSTLTEDAMKQVNFLIDVEVSHVNTRHPDFTEFTEGTSGDKESPDSATNKLVSGGSMNQIFKKGLMSLAYSGLVRSYKEYWFVLKGTSLTWYKDETEKETKFQVSIEHAKLKDHDSSSKKNSFVVMNKDGKNFTKDYKNLEFSCATIEEAEDWKASFFAAGVTIDKKETDKNLINNDKLSNSTQKLDLLDDIDPTTLRQIEYIYSLVEMYLKIVTKTVIDITGKIVFFCIIKGIREFIVSDIVAHVYANGSIEDLMKESEELVQRRADLAKQYQTCQEALEIINRFMTSSDLLSESSVYRSSQNTRPAPTMQQDPYGNTRSVSASSVGQLSASKSLESISNNSGSYKSHSQSKMEFHAPNVHQAPQSLFRDEAVSTAKRSLPRIPQRPPPR